MKILLVDDDAGVVQSLSALLQGVPEHEVRTAATGGQALQSAMAMGGVDLLITDVVMEPMDGFTLRDHVTNRFPSSRTIFISGYDLTDYAGQTANHQVLAKPIDKADLLAAIDREFGTVAASGEAAPAEPVIEVSPEAAEPEPTAAEAEPIPQIPPAPEPALELASVAEPEPALESAPTAEPEPALEMAPAAQPEAVPQPAAVSVTHPVAVPRVAAVPQVAAGAGPRAVAVPKATPAATPIAVPKVAAVPQVAATPRAAVAAAQPKAVAQPTASPAPQATATPRAVPVGQPKAVAQPTATAVPRAVPAAVQPTATPRVAGQPAAAVPTAPQPVARAAQPTAIPRVAAAAQPTVKPQAPAAVAAATPVVPPPSAAGDESVPPADTSLIGQTIGSYQIISLLGAGRWGSVYLAMQTSINRQVGLKVLAASQSHDETAKARFLGDARAKAHVQNPSILAVYEAGEASGHTFYAHEYVDGRNLAEIQRSGERLDEPTGLKVLKVTAEGLNYLNANHIPHSPPLANSVYLSKDGHPRVANLATQLADDQLPLDQEIQMLGRTMLSVLPSIQKVSPGFRALLSRMVQSGPQAVTSWVALIQGIKALEPKVIPAEAAKITAQDRAAIEAVEAARKAQKRSLYLNIGGLASLVLLAAFSLWWFLGSNERNMDEQVHIPAGNFTFGSGQTAQTGEFWIDKYEVTIGQYAKFVQALEENPHSKYDDPRQPPRKTATMHKPPDWNIYYGRARQGNAIHSVPSDLNMPAIMVDWWDAYAYAKWKGRELPTEEEWEKAARGTNGFIYPWGNEFDPRKANSSEGYVAQDPGKKASVDGFNYWGPVDKQRDKSPFGVLGMAGNVAEWTATWSADKKHPIIKGGSFMSTDVRLDKRVDNVSPDIAQENIGFRTISHKPPEK
ncbi:MAG: gamma-glutamyl hercynylcysteine S-oxide synthase [Chthoniobacter sp.]|jgi:formylglycine-generating enzyme required for sulfatase activity/CheY-like chemotaxis protein|nr:gamma-glutamyl hercynylcysteine S-oxide synthase [Chthoniobacter sp.]